MPLQPLIRAASPGAVTRHAYSTPLHMRKARSNPHVHACMNVVRVDIMMEP